MSTSRRFRYDPPHSYNIFVCLLDNPWIPPVHFIYHPCIHSHDSVSKIRSGFGVHPFRAGTSQEMNSLQWQEMIHVMAFWM